MNSVSAIIKNHYFQILIFFIGMAAILIRLIHLVYNPLFYGDETGLYENIRNSDYISLLKGLNFVQAAPPVFLLLSKFIYEIFKNQTQYIIDLSLRIVPFLCSVLSIFTFWKFNKLIFNNNFQRGVAFLLFALNTQNIAYCAIFKQYSMELLISTILLITSYKIIFMNKCKWYYILAISLSIWFSYSSVFIMVPLLVYLLFKKKDIFKLTIIPIILSALVLWFASLRYIVSTSYIAMQKCWMGLDWGYLDLSHPSRIFIRFGEFFVFGATTPDKILTIICGILIVYAIITFVFSNNKYKWFLFSPILLVLLASIFHKYPIVVRLILFILPIISIIIADYNSKFTKSFIITMCLLSSLSCIYYIPTVNHPFTDTERNNIEYSKGYLNLDR